MSGAGGVGYNLVGKVWGSLFDPATLSLDFYQRADYPGATTLWPGTASAGTSGTHSCPAVTNQATQGAAQNGKLPASFGAGHVSCHADTTLDQYITTASFSGATVFNATTADADHAGSPYLNSQIMADGANALFGCSFSANGVDVWMYDGAWHRVQIACATGGYHALQFYYDNVNLHARLDSGVWSSTPVTAGFGGFNLATQTCNLGSAPYSSTSFTGLGVEYFLSKSQLALLDFDHYLSYVDAIYGLSL